MINRSIVGPAVVLFSIRIVGVILLLVQVALVAYLQDLNMVGLNGILWSAAVIFRVAGPLGVDVMAMKEANNPDANSAIGYVSGLVARDTIGLLKVWTPALAVVLGVWCAATSFGADSGLLIPVLAFSCFASLFHRLWFMSLVARHRPFVGQLLESIFLPVLAIIAVLLVPSDDQTTFLLGQAASIIAVAAILGVIALNFPREVRVNTPRINWRGALTVALGASLTALAVRSPIFFVGHASVRMAGEYDIAQRFQSAGSIGVSAVSTAIMPKLSETIQRGHRKTLSQLLATGSAVSASIPIVLLTLLLLAGGETVGRLLGPEFEPLWMPTIILTTASVLNALTSSVSNALSLGGSQKWFAWISGLQLSFIAAVAFLLQQPRTDEMAFIVLASELLRSVLLVVAFYLSIYRTMARHRADG